MPEYVQLNRDSKNIEVISTGDVSPEDLKKSLESVVELRKTTGYRLVLCDTQYQLSMPHLRDYKAFIESLPSDLVVAVLVNYNGATRDVQHMGEAMAQRTPTAYKLFYEKEKALEWLEFMRQFINRN